MKKRHWFAGFTLIETVLTMGTVVLATGVAVPMYRQYLIRNDLEIARQNVAQGLERAKFLSQVAMNDSAWGFSTNAVPGRGVLYMGDSYALRNSDFDEMYTISSTITVSGLTEVTFNKISGLPNQTGSMVLTALTGDQFTISVDIGADGNVSVPDDWLTICVDPYGESPVTMQVPDSLWEVYSAEGAQLGPCSEQGGDSGGSGGSGGSDPVCGNSVVEDGEACDDGGEDTADCDANCSTNVCGDSYQNAVSEECDDGGVDTADCDSDCTAVSCGDAHYNSVTEECDGGGDNPICDSDCTLALCGDGYFNSAAETCESNGVDSVSCDSDCTAVECGDGHVNAAAGEECDDGNDIDSDECTNSCTNPICGDSIVQTEEEEECDPAPAGAENSATCNVDCTSVYCGDGIYNSAAGEECDDGNVSNTDTCVTISSQCYVAVCGDNYVLDGEEDCDEGGSDTATCDADCTSVSCGDEYVNSATETCDAGAVNTASCDYDCTSPACGDGIVNTYDSEECDDGNTDNSDGCSSTCTRENTSTPSAPRFKISFDRTETTGTASLTTNVFVGAMGEVFAEDEWIALQDGGSNNIIDDSIMDSVLGLTVQRRDGYIRVKLPGNSSSEVGTQIVDANVIFEGVTVSSVSNDTGDDKAENPFDGTVNDTDGGDEATTSSDTQVLFQARVDTDGDSILIVWEGEVEDPDFDIDDDTVTPDADYTCTLRVLGSEITSGGLYDMPVTVRKRLGGSTWVDVFGDWELPVDSNVNDDSVHTFTCSNQDGGVAIDMKARSWYKYRWWYSGSSNSHWSASMTRDTTSGDDANIIVLRDGDTVPSVPGFQNQASVQDFVEDYVNLSTGLMELGDQQVIYLFELGTTDLNSSAADFQDLVLLLTIEGV